MLSCDYTKEEQRSFGYQLQSEEAIKSRVQAWLQEDYKHLET